MDPPTRRPHFTREILLRVFTFASQDGDDMPTLARCGRVCQTWRRLALGQPMLWRTINIGRRITAAQVHALTSLSAGVPLHVRVIHQTTQSGRLPPGAVEDTSGALFAELARTNHERIVVLEVAVVLAPSEFAPLPLLTVTAPTPTKPGSSATTSAVNVPDARSPFELPLVSTPPESESSPWITLQDGRTWPMLERLLVVQLECPARIKFKLAITTPRLKQMRLHGAVVDWATARFGDKLEHLTSFKTNVSQHLSLTLNSASQSLRVLALMNGPQEAVDFGLVLTHLAGSPPLFPRLRDLKLAWQPLGLQQILQFLALCSPELVALEITSYAPLRSPAPGVVVSPILPGFNLQRCVLQFWTAEGHNDPRPCGELMRHILRRPSTSLQQLQLANAIAYQLEEVISTSLRSLSIIGLQRSQVQLRAIYNALRACPALEELELVLPWKGASRPDLVGLLRPTPIQRWTSFKIQFLSDRTPTRLAGPNTDGLSAEIVALHHFLQLAVRGHQPRSTLEIDSYGLPGNAIPVTLGAPIIRPAPGELVLALEADGEAHVRVLVQSLTPGYRRSFYMLTTESFDWLLQPKTSLQFRTRSLTLDLRIAAAFLVALGASDTDAGTEMETGEMANLEVLNIDVDPQRDVEIVESTLDIVVLSRGGVPLRCPALKLVLFRASTQAAPMLIPGSQPQPPPPNIPGAPLQPPSDNTTNPNQPPGAIEPGIGGGYYLHGTGTAAYTKIPLKKRTLDAFWACFESNMEVQIHASVLRFAIWYDNGAVRTLPDPQAAAVMVKSPSAGAGASGAGKIADRVRVERPASPITECVSMGLGFETGAAEDGSTGGSEDADADASTARSMSPISEAPAPAVAAVPAAEQTAVDRLLQLPSVVGLRWRWHPNSLR